MSELVVGVFGLGAMGSAMAAHLGAAGLQVLGCDPDPDRQQLAAASGIEITSPESIGVRADIVVTSLPSHDAALAVLSTDSPLCTHARPGLVILETSTLSLESKRYLLDQVSSAGGTLLDCPMSGTAHQARARDLVAYLSGDDDESKSAALPVLNAFCRSVRDLGKFGNGTLTKLIANHLVAVHNVAAAEALGLAQAAGLDLSSTLAAVADGAGASRMLEVRGPLMIDEDYLPAGMSVDLFMKDLGLINAFSLDVGATSPLLDASIRVYEEAQAQGRGPEDTACTFSVLRSRSEALREDDEA